MLFYKNFSSYHMDVLKEIGNIGAGHAATALSNLLNQTVDMKVPDVSIVKFDDLMEKVGGADHLVAGVFLRIEGDAPGSLYFLLSLEEAEMLVRRITGDTSLSFKEPPYPEMGLSAFCEVGNILAGSYLSSLADFTGMNLHPSVPATAIDLAGALLSYGLIELSQESDYAIVIDTAFIEHGNAKANHLNGHFLVLPDPPSFDVIFRSLGVPSDG
ncbi:chemotaxis protein CheC [Bacillus marinisedimentorum]|uniref:chemotaxis protein CheC n=1 Tax=Bacillus marinisedimentorum TaxID=1821260 RepID=UPI0007E193A5|nr:chemotaxis protein CheC [Bacillus marinisedimentorum]